MVQEASKEILHDVPPYIRVYKDGTIERLVGLEVAEAGFDQETGVNSKDIVISTDTGVSARLYRPSNASGKLPLLVYFHGGAFCVASVSHDKYHVSLNKIVAEAGVVAISVNYWSVPEHPLPAAFDDSWDALEWVASHNGGTGSEDWIRDGVDFDRVFLGGDSCGATIAHHMDIRVGDPDAKIRLKIHGTVMFMPYFWGKEPIGSELTDPFRRGMVDNFWRFVCPFDKGSDDSLINPFSPGSPDLSGLGSGRVLICVAEKDILSSRGRVYYETLSKSQWKGKADYVEMEGVDHVFHLFDPNGEKAMNLYKCFAAFIKQARLMDI